MMRKNQSPHSSKYNDVNYTKMQAKNDGFVDMQVRLIIVFSILSVIIYHLYLNVFLFFFKFEQPPSKIPWKAIALAFVLFLGGTFFLVLGSLLVSGHIDAKVIYID